MRSRARLLPCLLASGLVGALLASAALALGAPALHAPRAKSANRCAAKARGHARGKRRCRHGRRGATRRRVASNQGATGGSLTSGSAVSGGTPAPAQPEGSAPGRPAGESGSSAPVATHVQVSAVEFRYTLSRSSVPAGKVIFEFVDDGQDEHNLNVGSSEGELELSFATAQPKSVSDQAVVLKKGTYTLFCSLPEHEAKGMKATLEVT